MEKFRVTDIANLLKVAQMTVYRKVKKLKKELSNHIIKEKGVTFFTSEGLEIIRKSITTAPTETTMEGIHPVLAPFDLSPVVSRFSDMEKGILAITETVARLVEENRALRSEVSNLRNCLEYKKLEPAKTDTKRENHLSSEFQSRRADPREVVSSQRELSLWESVQASFDTFTGFLFG